MAAGLAVLGRTGTLAGILTDEPGRRALHAKTGTLTGVKSLAGFADAPEASAT